ncbi:THUMP domain-containing protein 3 isoform X2 [Orussus abietinus]|uniref:THUMP domain-containing protein 3 isoform X2 n=1 Tax=Orussus abietinus TaxID=222816 RepID=UPI0006250791|nr:THUMP domain-containing protein 3 isoform X2 [Orussus abietinus]
MSRANDLELQELFIISQINGIFTIGMTVTTGFEWQAVDECREKLKPTTGIVKRRGKIYCNVSLDQFLKVQEMRSVDNIYIIADVSTFNFITSEKEGNFELIRDAVQNNMGLEKHLNAWKIATHFRGILYPTEEEFNSAHASHKTRKEQFNDNTTVNNRSKKRGQDPSTVQENSILKFRVTCERTGEHAFESGEVAKHVGAVLQDKYHWLVDLIAYHLEVVCHLISEEFIVGLRVTTESKHRRNISHFGPTTLRATVCYNLLRLAHPKLGDVVIDPMCGGGSIPIEAAMAYPESYIFCGDHHSKAVNRAKCNIDDMRNKGTIDVLQWNASKIPLRSSCIDIFVTDMSWVELQKLEPAVW